VLASDDLLVFEGQQQATGFAITGIGDPEGGEVEFGVPPAPGSTITLLRRTEGIRETEFVDGGPFRAAAINAELDRIILLIQETGRARSHAERLSGGGRHRLRLPPTTERANKVLGSTWGNPAVFGMTALPTSGDASGALVTLTGATTACSASTAARVNVRDFGALAMASLTTTPLLRRRSPRRKVGPPWSTCRPAQRRMCSALPSCSTP
jgi:hypothetical protein